jgi:hypothetical protein
MSTGTFHVGPDAGASGTVGYSTVIDAAHASTPSEDPTAVERELSLPGAALAVDLTFPLFSFH